MTISEQLADAMKVSIRVGQYVIVRTEAGDQVAEGYVEAVDPDMGVVRVRDYQTGTDVQYDVDSSKYQLWVEPAQGYAPGEEKPENLFVRQSMGGPYGHGTARTP